MQLVNFQAPIRRNAPLNKGLLRWWRAEPFRTSSPRLQDLTCKSPMALTGALRLGKRAARGASGTSTFNGTSDSGQTSAINLSAVNTLSIAINYYWNANSSNDDMLLETGAAGASPGEIIISPNNGSGSMRVSVFVSAGLRQSFIFTRPSAAVWHHGVFCFDRGGGSNQITAVYIDGVSQTLTPNETNTGASGGFGNEVWYLMSRGGSVFFGAGRIDDIRVYDRVLPAWEVRALLAASRRGYPQELRWSRGAEFGGYIDEAPPEDPYIPYSVPYHRRSFKAMAPIKNAGHAMSSLSSVVALTTIPGNALRARVVGVSGSATVYFREDSGTPSSSNGTPIGAGGYADIVGRNNLEGFRAIEASPSGTLWVEYFDSVE